MPRTSSNPRIVNRTGRIKLSARRDPYWHLIAEGQHLGYRKGAASGTWIARYYTPEHGRRFYALGAADDAAQSDGSNVLSFHQALEAAQKWFTTVAHGDTGQILAGSYTVKRACEDYLKDKEREKDITMTHDRATINAHILPTLGHIELAKLTHGRLKAWRDNLADTAPRLRSKAGKPQIFSDRPKSKATVNKCLNVLKAVLNYAKTERRAVATDAAWCDVKPFKGADQPKVRFLSANEIKTFVPACEDDFQRLVKGAILTGARYGELTRLEVENFNAKDGKLFIAKSKNGEARFVDLNAEGIALFAALTVGRESSERIFLKSNGKEWKTSEQKRPMDAACEAAEVEGVTFHILRHTYASHALKNKMPLEVLKEQLGHKTLAITIRHYAHLCADYKQQSVRAHAPSFGFTADAKPFLVAKQA